MSLKKRYEDWKKQRLIKKYIRENKWQGLIPGDIVEYKNKKFMYRGINKNGGPGMPGRPEPIFGPIHPNDPVCLYYLRYPNKIFPESVFGEDVKPAQAGGSGTYIGFLNAGRSELEKVDHITPEQWDAMATA